MLSQDYSLGYPRNRIFFKVYMDFALFTNGSLLSTDRVTFTPCRGNNFIPLGSPVAFHISDSVSMTRVYRRER